MFGLILGVIAGAAVGWYFNSQISYVIDLIKKLDFAKK